MELESINGDQRKLCACRHHVVGRVNPQPFAIHFQPAHQRDVEFIEFHAAVETVAQGLDNATFQDRRCTMNHYFGDHHQDDHADKQGPHHPPPYTTATRLRFTLDFCRVCQKRVHQIDIT